MNLQRFRLPNGFRKLFTKKRVLIAGSAVLAFLIITPVLTYASNAREISDPERLMNHNSSGIIIKDRDSKVLYEQGVVSDNARVELSGISDSLEQALLASEDRGFYDHQGYSVRGILGAIRDNIQNKDATNRGGSTITQQLVKNKLLTTDKSFLRKYQELSMAIAVERRYSKEEILEMYLNSVYFGEGAFGVTEAAKTYFNTSPANLTTAQSAMLVGLLPAPTTYSPISGEEGLAEEQQQRVLRDMVEAGYLEESEMETIASEPLAVSESREGSFTTAQHFIMMVRAELNEQYGEERVIRSGFIVTTSLDADWQKTAEDTVKKRIAEFSAQGGTNAGLVSIDPKTGQVRALVGSVDWDNEEFGKVNMATSPRQPGSSFKPIYYAEALDRGLITPATVMKDERKTYGADYRPENYDFKFRGEITIRNALAQSLNIPAVDVMQKLNPYEATEAAQRMGISDVNDPDMYGLSLALGTAEVKLYDMVNAYAAFANSGKQFEPTFITNIEDKYGKTIYEHREQESEEVISPEASYLISSILSDERARAPLYGTRLNIPGQQVAMKTGTTNDNKDAWTIGYTPAVVTGVWVGNNQNEPMRGLAGGSAAGTIWKETMISYLNEVPKQSFVKPSGIVEKQVCGTNNTSTYREYFIKGTEPGSDCTPKPVEPKDRPRPEEGDEQPEEKPEETPPEEPLTPDEPEEPVAPEEPQPDPGDTGGRGGGDEPTDPEPTPEGGTEPVSPTSETSETTSQSTN